MVRITKNEQQKPIDYVNYETIRIHDLCKLEEVRRPVEAQVLKLEVKTKVSKDAETEPDAEDQTITRESVELGEKLVITLKILLIGPNLI